MNFEMNIKKYSHLKFCVFGIIFIFFLSCSSTHNIQKYFSDNKLKYLVNFNFQKLKMDDKDAEIIKKFSENLKDKYTFDECHSLNKKAQAFVFKNLTIHLEYGEKYIWVGVSAFVDIATNSDIPVERNKKYNMAILNNIAVFEFSEKIEFLGWVY